VTFKDGANDLKSPAVGPDGKAIFQTNTLTVGTHSITAVYADNVDQNYSGSTSNTVSQEVDVAPIITTLTPAGGPVGMGFTITGTNFGTNTGSVTVNGVTAVVLQWADTSITVQVPVQPQGTVLPKTVPVVVSTSDNKTSEPSNFTVRDRFIKDCAP
jgi:hypothetical protein